MEIKMKMPDLATNEGEELGVARWIASVGDSVRRGEPLLEVETDKATQEVECIATGVLQSILVQAGESVPVGTIIATIKVG
jgi:pyruvate/2-oxoglutarate dehydrogenase complex dihydrolipoamide acyltransferase (E2) component